MPLVFLSDQKIARYAVRMPSPEALAPDSFHRKNGRAKAPQFEDEKRSSTGDQIPTHRDRHQCQWDSPRPDPKQRNS